MREKFAVGVAAPLFLLVFVVVVVVGLVEVCRFIGLLVFDFVFGAVGLQAEVEIEIGSGIGIGFGIGLGNC